MILGLQELKFIFNPVTGLGYGEFEARLAGLMWSLKEGCKNHISPDTVESFIHLFFFPALLLRGAEYFSH